MMKYLVARPFLTALIIIAIIVILYFIFKGKKKVVVNTGTGTPTDTSTNTNILNTTRVQVSGNRIPMSGGVTNPSEPGRPGQAPSMRVGGGGTGGKR